MANLVQLITPTNLSEEKAKFFKSDTYSPIFRYSWQNLDNIDFKNPAKNKLWQAILDQNHRQITNLASKLFEVIFDNQALTTARKYANNTVQNEQGTAEQYAEELRIGLDHFHLSKINVEIVNESGYNSRPLHGQNKILISSDIHFGYFSVAAGVHHELVHVIRYQNGIYNHIPTSSRYLPTEEGLASWCQDNTNADNGIAQHAIEYLGSYVGQNASLRDIYNTMRDLGMNQELAWKRASRHKFGFVDTSLPGDIMKPAMYFGNELKVSDLSTEERVRLFVGKISINELGSYPKYVGLWPENQLTEYFNL